MDYAVQTPYSDPGEYAHLFDALPDDIPAIGAVVRNLLIHYRGGGIEFTGDRLAEIDHRWVASILATDQRRNGAPLAVPREPFDRVVGCCRDYTLLFVSALRHKGIPARSRIGFATYFAEGFNHDHVVAEYWNGDRWVMVDAQLEPAEHDQFNTLDLPPGPFVSAAEVWRDSRAGRIDPELYGVEPGLAITGSRARHLATRLRASRALVHPHLRALPACPPDGRGTLTLGNLGVARPDLHRGRSRRDRRGCRPPDRR